MHINILNGCLLLAWILITAGGLVLNIGAGLLLSGVVLILLVLYLVAKFGVYSPKPSKTHEEN